MRVSFPDNRGNKRETQLECLAKVTICCRNVGHLWGFVTDGKIGAFTARLRLDYYSPAYVSFAPLQRLRVSNK